MKATWNYYSSRGTVKFNGEWHKCGKRGHYCQNFWELKNNASSFHRVWKLSYEAYNTSTNTQSKENDTPEFMLMNIDGVDDEDMVLVAQEFPNNLTLINDTNVVISDSGAPCYSTPHAMGFTNTRTASNCD